MVAIAVAHCAVTEYLTTRSLGKWILDGFVVAGDGTRPSLLRVVTRNAVKLLVLVLPPLVLLGLLNPNLQGMHDLVAGTVVAERRGTDDEDAPDIILYARGVGRVQETSADTAIGLTQMANESAR